MFYSKLEDEFCTEGARGEVEALNALLHKLVATGGRLQAFKAETWTWAKGLFIAFTKIAYIIELPDSSAAPVADRSKLQGRFTTSGVIGLATGLQGLLRNLRASRCTISSFEQKSTGWLITSSTIHYVVEGSAEEISVFSLLAI